MERIVLHADDGMVLTDGTVYGKIIYLAEGADPSAYRQITEAEYEEITAETALLDRYDVEHSE